MSGQAQPVAPIAMAPQTLPQLPPTQPDFLSAMDYEEQMARMRQPEPAYEYEEPPPQQDYQVPDEGGVISFRDTKLTNEFDPNTVIGGEPTTWIKQVKQGWVCLSKGMLGML